MNIEQKFGAATIIGLPNAGKSTLTNALVGSKVSIVTRKRNTTRQRITGIMMHDNAQVVLMDTPGVFQPGSSQLEKTMYGAVQASLNDTHCIMHVVDCQRDPNDQRQIIKLLPDNVPCILVLNKIDQIRKTKLMPYAQTMQSLYNYDTIFMVAADKSDGIEAVRDHIASLTPEGPWQFDEDDLSTQPLALMAAEITRETVFEIVHDEIPYAVHLETETIEHFDNGALKLSQIIYVTRDMHKAIILGKGGQKVKEIGQVSREKMTEAFGQTVHLSLFVKVKPDWSRDSDILRQMKNA